MDRFGHEVLGGGGMGNVAGSAIGLFDRIVAVFGGEAGFIGLVALETELIAVFFQEMGEVAAVEFMAGSAASFHGFVRMLLLEFLCVVALKAEFGHGGLEQAGSLAFVRIMTGGALIVPGGLVHHFFRKAERIGFMAGGAQIGHDIFLEAERADLAMGFMAGQAFAFLGWVMGKFAAEIVFLVTIQAVALFAEAAAALGLGQRIGRSEQTDEAGGEQQQHSGAGRES
jgi:hypothetical protein